VLQAALAGPAGTHVDYITLLLMTIRVLVCWLYAISSTRRSQARQACCSCLSPAFCLCSNGWEELVGCDWCISETPGVPLLPRKESESIPARCGTCDLGQRTGIQQWIPKKKKAYSSGVRCVYYYVAV
jgi:hypothetical protein